LSSSTTFERTSPVADSPTSLFEAITLKGADQTIVIRLDLLPGEDRLYVFVNFTFILLSLAHKLSGFKRIEIRPVAEEPWVLEQNDSIILNIMALSDPIQQTRSGARLIDCVLPQNLFTEL